MTLVNIINGSLLRQIIIFGISGVVATFAHLGTLVFLVEALKINILPSSTIGFVLAVILSYKINHRWTFNATGCHKEYFPRYIITCMIGLCINTTIIFITNSLMGWWYLYSQFAALAIVPFCNFMLNRNWVFSGTRTCKQPI